MGHGDRRSDDRAGRPDEADGQLDEAEAIDVDVAVVGAGIAGLAVARGLVDAGLRTMVLESRGRVGGRLLSRHGLDLGASWFWPGEQRVAALVEMLGIATHPQHIAGNAMYHDPSGSRPVDGNPIDVPSGRFTAGAQSLADGLARTLPDGTIRLGCPVTAVTDHGPHLTVESRAGDDGPGQSGGPDRVRAHQVVLAVPPALAVHRLSFEPGLPDRLAALAAATPVWMGSVAKVVARYDRPFWRDRGLAGSAISHLGPLREIHDLSGPDGDPAALFGFAPRTSAGPRPTDEELCRQLGALFGPEAATPTELLVLDWLAEPDTAPPAADRLTLYATYGHELYHTPTWGGRLHWASTETGRVAPGHIEGALEAAERVVATITADGGPPAGRAEPPPRSDAAPTPSEGVRP